MVSWLVQQLAQKPKEGIMTDRVIYVSLLVVWKEASDFILHSFRSSLLLSYLWPALLQLLLIQALSFCAKSSRSCSVMPAKMHGHLGKVPWVLSPSCGCTDKAFVSLDLLSQAMQGPTLGSEESPSPAVSRRGISCACSHVINMLSIKT